jgi:hypothetical protein
METEVQDYLDKREIEREGGRGRERERRQYKIL